ncbi:hypothetical protein MVES1_001590 [Malassezia vespertilionis]|uniref:Uncharacterized protein n=1 Tax=Malassezia vespertilionis TaxID=2020962 RepID=A0A2N1JCZ8_9BASI|nr:uncharacterized protein MVES1_001590 [Malassezia vespertilionis]PKI84441.1 hypothetical protein MVES_001497 [Malassezia vespertilionis]WFD06245.1 hypothetical protein MVES1_001590 [Malassezia vespertilionis]
MARKMEAAAPLVQTPIQLSGHSLPRNTSTTVLCTSHSTNARRSYVAIGDVVRASATSGVRRRRGLAASIEQGVAVVLMDVNTQMPMHTYTLRPSDHITSPPLVVERALHAAGDKKLVRTTYLGAQDASGTVLWVLTESLDMRGKRIAELDPEKAVHSVAGAPLEALFSLRSGDLLAVRADGTVVLLAEPLSSQSLVKYTAEIGSFLPRMRLDTQMLDAPFAKALLHHAPNAASMLGALLLVSAPQTKDAQLSVRALAVHAEAPFLRAYDSAPLFPSVPASKVISSSVHPSGALCALSKSGELCTANLSLEHNALDALDPHTVALPALRGAAKSAVRALLLSPSHLLLLTVPSGDVQSAKERAAALIWDVDLDTILTRVEWSLGNTPGKHGQLCVTAVPATDSHVLVQVDSGTSTDAMRSSILALPVSVPTTGLLRHALGTAAQTSAWLAPDATFSTDAVLEPSHASFLRTLESLAEEERARTLEATFPTWRKEESARLRSAEHVKASRKTPKPVLENAFVARLLAIALPHASSGKSTLEAPNTLRYLLERNAVSSTMMRGPKEHDSLLARVRATNDWSILYLLLRHVPDLAEMHAITILHDVLAQQNDPAAPTIARVLQHILAPPKFAKPALRMALRTQIRSNEHVLILLDIVRRWLDAVLSGPLDRQLGLQKDGMCTVPHTQIQYSSGDVHAPELETLVSFAEDLLDTYFPQLLASTSTHAFLAECTKAVAQHTQQLQSIARLQGPLDAFLHAEKSKEGKGKRKAEGKSKRLALHEASLLVPPYSVETLDV